jgi:signal transduction histidine kinase/ligand-binding sensor domain-containing protein
MTLKPFFVFLVCLIFSGCRFSNRSIPLPVNEPEFSLPAQKPLIFSAPRKVKWNVVNTDSITKQGRMTDFDISKLPSRPFNPRGFNALSKPATEKTFQYNTLPDTILNLDVIASVPLIFKTSLLGMLKKITLTAPRIRAESFFTSFQYSIEQGLPGANVQCTLHTKDGLVWIATDAGLCVLNGETLEIFTDSYGTISNMAEDNLGHVWLLTRTQGVIVVDRKAGIQKNFDFQGGTQMRFDRNGFIWLCSLDLGVYLINPDLKSFKHITRKNGLSSSQSFRTLEDDDGRIWITNFETGIDILDPTTRKIKRLGKAQGLDIDYVFSVAKNKAGDMYVGGYKKGIDIINIGKQTIKHIDSAQGLKKTRIFNMLEDEEGRMWIATDSSGVFILNNKTDSVAHIGVQEGLGGDATWWLDKDDQHQMYVGTLAGGMNIFPPANRVAHIFTKKDGLLGNDIWGLFEDSKQRIWIGTYSGANILTPDGKILNLLVNPGGYNITVSFLQTGPDQFAMAGSDIGLVLIDETKHTMEKMILKAGPPYTDIFNMFRDRRGRFWLGTFRNGVILVDPQNRSVRSLNQAYGLSNNRVNNVMEDNTGKIWLATAAGIDILDPNKDTIRSFSKREGLSNESTISVLEDKKNRFWVTTENGLNLLDPLNETNTIFSVSSGMAANGIYSLLEKDGRIYAGTGNGLTVLEENDRAGSHGSTWNLQTYGQPQGFPNLNFNENASLITHTTQLWWGIQPNLTTLDESAIRTDSVTHPAQVIGVDLFGVPQCFTDQKLIQNIDTLWYANKDSFYLNGSFGTLNTNLKKGIEWDSLSTAFLPVNLSDPYDQNYLRFHFGNILPQFAGDFKYRYILDGVDEKWSPVTTQTVSENYNNISPGYYTFRVSAQKGFGPWSAPSVYRFRIRPPWWLSWWAEAGYLLIFIAALRLWIRYRSRRLLKENARLEEKVTDRMTALTASLENLRQTQSQLIQAEKMASLGELTAGIAHEIQNPLNFVNNFSEVNTELLEDVNNALDQGDIPEVKNILKDVEMNMGKITLHGKRADAIVKGMLLHSRASSGQKIPTDVNALADEYLRLSYHGLRAKDKSFNAQFNMDFDDSLMPVMLVQQDIGRVLLNLFNNSFYSVSEKKKLNPEGYQPIVLVSTKRKQDTIEIRIRDNGLGIPKKVIDKIYQPFFTTKPAGQGTGLGLSLSYDIITKEHGGKIDVTTKENEFTEFIMVLPIQTIVPET